MVLPVSFMRSWPSFLLGYAFLQNLDGILHSYQASLRQVKKTSKHPERRDHEQQHVTALESLRDDGKALLSEDEMMGNLLVFTSAGFDTTANTLSYAPVLLYR